ncbi:MAG: hypothetical protein AAFQ45_10010 [Pseudomonadota bacterium]
MTTINATAKVRDHRLKPAAAFAVLAAAAMLAGCANSGSNLLDGANGTPNASIATGSPAAAKPANRIALAPIIGAPETVASQLSTQLTSSLSKKGVGVAKGANEKADYTLRGYVVAARERSGTKVSYIWDVTNPTGERVNRITGEEIINGSNGRDPWQAVSPTIIAQIVDKTATSLGNWLPKKAAPSPQTPAQPLVATPGSTGPRATTGQPTQIAANPLVATPGATATPAVQGVSRTTTGSIPRLTAVSPRVSGAPGDGSTSLARALSKELSGQGVSMVNSPTAQAYKVTGKVVVGTARSGKQPIQIDWDVRDPKGANLGTVSQKNEIPAGSLNGAWGRTADAAAGAAAQGIMRLIRQNQAATKTN